MKIKFRINLIARASPHSSSLTQGVGRDPGSELEEGTPWPSKNPGRTLWNVKGSQSDVEQLLPRSCLKITRISSQTPRDSLSPRQKAQLRTKSNQECRPDTTDI